MGEGYEDPAVFAAEADKSVQRGREAFELGRYEAAGKHMRRAQELYRMVGRDDGIEYCKTHIKTVNSKRKEAAAARRKKNAAQRAARASASAATSSQSLGVEAEEKVEVSPVVMPSTTFDDIIGMDDLKAEIRQTLMLRHAFGGKVAAEVAYTSLLLYGPPGTGKTEMAKAIAHEIGKGLIMASAADLVVKWVGETGQNIKALFRQVCETPGVVLFIDEVDCLFGQRGDTDTEGSKQAKNQFLVELSALEDSRGDAVLVCATNLPWQIDSGFVRRFTQHVHVPLPDPDARWRMLKMRVPDAEQVLGEEGQRQLIARTELFSGSDMRRLALRILRAPMVRALSATHFVLLPPDSNGKTLYAPSEPDAPTARRLDPKDLPPGSLAEPDLNPKDVWDQIEAKSGMRTTSRDLLEKMARFEASLN